MALSTDRSKVNAWRAKSKAIRNNEISNPLRCSICRKQVLDHRDLQAHHPDYNKRLEVVWMCSSCHSKHTNHDSEEPANLFDTIVYGIGKFDADDEDELDYELI